MGKSGRGLIFAFAAALQMPSAAAHSDRMLLYSRTTGYRHESISAAVAAIRTLAARHGIDVDHTEDAAVFHRDKLSAFKAVAFVNTTGNVLTEEEQRAFEGFIADSGGYLGVHSAADTEYDWPWYGQLVGAWFKSHPPGLQTGTLRFAGPLRENLPVQWRLTDEFYNFRSRPSGAATIIATLEENTYQGGEMGVDHPISWCQKIHGGRSWYTGLGHRPQLFADPVFLAHLEKGILYATSRSEEC
jgi:uncharacterized protein